MDGMLSQLQNMKILGKHLPVLENSFLLEVDMSQHMRLQQLSRQQPAPVQTTVASLNEKSQ